MTQYTFEIGGGQTNQKGKLDWPDVLNVDMPRQDAFELLSRIAHQLAQEDRQWIGLDYCGEIGIVTEEPDA